MRSGRRSWVRVSACALRHRATRAWSPDRNTSGTGQPRSPAGRVYCGYSSSPSPKLSSSADCRCPSLPGPAGRRPRSPRSRPLHRRPGRSRRGKARRPSGGRRHAGPRPRSARTAARIRPLADSSTALSLIEATPPGPSSRSGRGGSAASTAANTARGQHHARPPPKGLSSTDRCGSDVPARRSWTRRSSRPAAAGPPDQAGGRPGDDQIRENGEHIDAHGRSSQLDQFQQPRGTSAVRRPGCAVHDETQRDQVRRPPEHEQVAGRVGLDRLDDPDRRSQEMTTSAPINSCTHQSVAVDDRRRPEHGVTQVLGLLR